MSSEVERDVFELSAGASKERRGLVGICVKDVHEAGRGNIEHGIPEAMRRLDAVDVERHKQAAIILAGRRCG